MWKKTALLTAVAAALSSAANAADAFLLPKENILWYTAVSSDFDVPVLLPRGATSAKLVVSGKGYSRTYEEIGEGMLSLSLPSADSAGEENIYDLKLTFNDEPPTVQRARLAVCQGAASGGSASADVRTASLLEWHKVTKKALIPVRGGVDTLVVNGTPEDDSPWSSPGWFYLTAQSGKTYDLALKKGGDIVASATLNAAVNSLTIFIR
jgi:hypothetical protein